jgi:acyl-CoA thioesterase-1
MVALTSKYLVKIFSFILFVCAWNYSNGQQNKTIKSETKGQDQLTIVAFGNSITATRNTVKQVFAQRLPGLLKVKGINVRLINSGIGGSHTGRLIDNDRHKRRHALDRFETDVLEHKPDVVTIGFGTNDAYIDSKIEGGSSRIPLDKYAENLSYMITELQKSGAKVILIAPNALGKIQGDLQNERLVQYVEKVRKLSKKYGTGLVDNFKMFMEYHKVPGQNMDVLMLDGTHPNDQGHEMIAELIFKEIMRILNSK